ncbi:MAG TPA: hypothetical protein VNJ08_00740 [Bacteriovoracaceae bacterium]|nr:hypothetical protein [Bacteriovoracaceae bacterium]
MGKEILIFYPDFPYKTFIKLVDGLDDKELKARVLLITSELKKKLPTHYPDALAIIVKVIENGNLKGFALWPFSEYIGQFGLDHFDNSLKAMYILTQSFTSEFAIRPYLIKNPVRVMKYFQKWSTDKNTHVRRWVSEGSRPLLPWGERLPIFIMDPTPNLLLLDKLKFDPELYVRKSVANHLNDISKNQPLVVIKLLRMWEKDCPEEHLAKIKWIKSHALRTLIKKGHKDALEIMGVMGKAKVKISALMLNQKEYKLGDKLEFQVKLTSTSTKVQKIIIDYLIDFMKSNGTKSSKIFKFKTFELKAGESINLKKSHNLKPITTMTYYHGLHHLMIQVNGDVIAQADWRLSLKSN